MKEKRVQPPNPWRGRAADGPALAAGPGDASLGSSGLAGWAGVDPDGPLRRSVSGLGLS